MYSFLLLTIFFNFVKYFAEIQASIFFFHFEAEKFQRYQVNILLLCLSPSPFHKS